MIASSAFKITCKILKKGPFDTEARLPRDAASNRSANICSSFTNTCKEMGAKRLKKFSSCNSAAHGLENIQDREAANTDGGADREANGKTGGCVVRLRENGRWTVWSCRCLFLEGHVAPLPVPPAPLHQWKYYSSKALLNEQPQRSILV